MKRHRISPTPSEILVDHSSWITHNLAVVSHSVSKKKYHQPGRDILPDIVGEYSDHASPVLPEETGHKGVNAVVDVKTQLD